MVPLDNAKHAGDKEATLNVHIVAAAPDRGCIAVDQG
jgi:hypothetical protein